MKHEIKNNVKKTSGDAVFKPIFHLIIKTIKRIKFLSWKPILLFNFANPNNYKEENEKMKLAAIFVWVGYIGCFNFLVSCLK